MYDNGITVVPELLVFCFMFWYKLFRQTICFSILLLPMSVNMFYFGILFILVFNLCLLRDFFHLHILRTFVYIALSHGSLLSHQYSLRYRANMWSVCHMGLNVPVICYLKKKKKVLRGPKIILFIRGGHLYDT